MAPFLQRGAIFLVALAFLWPSTSLGVDLDDAIYRNVPLGVKLEIPDGWTLHRQTGFPSILLLLSRKESSATISLASAKLPAKTSMKRFLADNSAGLRAIGLRLLSTKQAILNSRPAWLIHAKAQGGAVELRQINLPQADRVFVLTLSCPAKEAEQLTFELNRLLEVLELSSPEKRETRELRPVPRPDSQLRPKPEGSPGPGLESGPLPGEPGSAPPSSRPGAEPKGPVSRPGVNSRPSGDSGRTVDSRPNRARTPGSRPTSRPARGTPPPKKDLPMLEGQEL